MDAMTTPPTVASTIAELTLEEKAALLSGADFWHTTRVERLGIPDIMLTDGPHGLRKARGGNQLGLGDSVPATCFPPAVALGCSWDADLVRRVGAAVGAEAVAEGVAVVLGPGVNIKRSPLCGRNFEYFSEDPIVAGVLGAAMVDGLQSRGVGASLKHFAANNQEHDRMRVSADVDPRPLREIYLRAFQRVVTEAHPWTVMCSYNRVNGMPASENHWLLTTVLRDEWGFDGVVVSDWGAVDDRVAAVAAGLDLEMPGSNGGTDGQVTAAVEDGSLDAQRVDEAAGRVLRLIRAAGRESTGVRVDVDEQHVLAREAAGRSIVLLRNSGGVLPLSRDANIAVVGAFAAEPRYQGAGSSMINPTRLDTALDEIRSLATRPVNHAADLRDDAVDVAAAADVVVVFLGLPAAMESEGYDRDDIDLPATQLELLDAVLEVNPNTVVVLSNGGVVTVPFAARVPALVEGWLLGQAGGGAIADVLFGVVNPSGKLTETIPLRLSDTPAYLDFPGESSHVRYGEGLFVGYRWYDARDVEVAYPFGHGLSYTTFEYGEATAVVNAAGDVDVHVAVGNVGPVAGREIVQLYTSLPGGRVQRPPRELKAFASVALDAGEARDVVLTVRRNDLAYWDIRTNSWIVEGGAYTVEVAASSRDVRSATRVEVDGDLVVVPLSRESTIAEVMAHPVAGPILQAAVASMLGDAEGAKAVMPDGDAMARMLASIPIGRVGMFAAAGGMAVDPVMIDALIDAANATP